MSSWVVEVVYAGTTLVLCRARDRWPFGLLDINNTFSVKVKGFGMSFRTDIVLTIYHLIVVLMNVVFVGWPKVQGMLSALSWRNRERSVCSGCRIS